MMHDAAQMTAECERVLKNAGHNIVSELLRFSEEFLEWNHVPPKDVHDGLSASQYYYHAHPREENRNGPHDDEHGHFHTFVRGQAIPADAVPCAADERDKKELSKKESNDLICHIIGVGMDSYGRPNKLFTTNRWVTGEDWFKAEDIIRFFDHFEIDHAYPSWPVNLWLTSVLRLFRPQIETLLKQRDERIVAWQKDNPGQNAYEDRALEVISALPVNIDEQRARIAEFCV